MTTKKTTWDTTHEAFTAIQDAETKARDDKTARLKAARKAAEASGDLVPKKMKGRAR